MALLLKDIYQETKNLYHLKLLCGEEGLNSLMNWVYVAEDPSTSAFLKGGELIITTGATRSGEDWLYRYVQILIRQNTCGLILNTGKYLHEEDVTEEICCLCNEHSFPLFVMPWEVHIFDITHDYYNRIFNETQTEALINTAFLNVIYQRPEAGRSLETLEEYGVPVSGRYRICYIRYRVSDAETCGDVSPSMWQEKLRFCLERFLTRLPGIYLCRTGKALLLVISCARQPDDSGAADAVSRHLRARFPELIFALGAGSCVDTLADLPVSCRHARAAASIAASQEEPLCIFDKLGFLKLLLSVQDKSLLAQYLDEQLGAVLEYDQRHGSSYTETLHQHLLCDGSVQAMAQALFCHRNTINYRIRVLKTELNLSLDDPRTRFELMAAFEVKRYLEHL